MPEPGREPGGYETRDMEPRLIGAFGLGVAGLIVVTVIVVAGLVLGTQAWLAGRAPEPSIFAGQAGEVPGPRLQDAPAREMQRTRQAWDRLLSEYAWVDRQAGLVRIPVERAMEIILARGLPRFEDAGEHEPGSREPPAAAPTPEGGE